MLTALEVQHIKDVISDLSAIADPSEFTLGEAEEALELLSKLEPIDCELGLQVFEEQIKQDELR